MTLVRRPRDRDREVPLDRRTVESLERDLATVTRYGYGDSTFARRLRAELDRRVNSSARV